MSIRPSFMGFDLNRLTSLFGCGDTSLALPICEPFFDEYLIEDEAERQGALKIVEDLLRGKYQHQSLNNEGEELQIMMDWMANYDQSPNRSFSIFWETFIYEVDKANAKYEGGPEQLLRYLLDGRPFFGKRVVYSSAYCAYFTNAEARTLFAFVRSQDIFRRAFDYESAENWMNEIEQSGQDVWLCMS